MAPPPYRWRFQFVCDSVDPLEGYLDSQKSYLVAKSQLEWCTICLGSSKDHKMRMMRVFCNSEECFKHHATHETKLCEWNVRVRVCQKTQATQVHQHDHHLTEARSTAKPKLNLQAKRFVKQCTDMKLKPSQTLNKMIDKFDLEDVRGLLAKVQDHSGEYRRTKLGDNNFMDEVLKTVQLYPFQSDLGRSVPFVFGLELNDDTTPKIPQGTETDPLLVGCSTHQMIRNLDRATDYPLHLDGTFKLSSFGYPVIVLGVSDAARQFHPVAFFLVSDLKQRQNQRALQSTFDIYKVITGASATVQYVMADADQAERNACEAVCGTDGPTVFQMCWFHVMQKVREYSKKLSPLGKSLVFRHVYRMHYARSEDHFEARKREAEVAWNSVDECKSFSAYFEKQWLSGRFSNWQSFHSPPGHAKTNNPLEQFNGQIKALYTNWELQSLNCLLKLLLDACKHRTIRQSEFITTPQPSARMVARYNRLKNEGALAVTRAYRFSIEFVMSGAPSNRTYFVTQRGTERAKPTQTLVDQALNTRLEEEGDEESEVFQQPARGWTVDVGANLCPCQSWAKDGYCVHLIASRVAASLPVVGIAQPRLKFENKRRRKSSGREARVGKALAKE